MEAIKNLSKRTKIIIAAAAGVVIVAAIVSLVVVITHKSNVKVAARANILGELDVLCAPNSIVPDDDGGFLITDLYGKKVWRIKNGKSTVYAGTDSVKDRYGEPIGGYNDAGYADSLFKEPWAISPFLGGYAVSDTANNSVRLLRTKEGTQTINGASDVLEMSEYGVTFESPTGLATDDEGNLYISDTGRGAVRKITTNGEVETVVEDLAGPTGLCYADGALYIAETDAERVISVKDGVISPVAGSGEVGDADGNAESASFASPQGVAVAEDGTVYIADTVNASVRRVKDGKVDTILSPSDAYLSTSPVSPTGLCISDNTLYVCDYFSRMIYTIPIK